MQAKSHNKLHNDGALAYLDLDWSTRKLNGHGKNMLLLNFQWPAGTCWKDLCTAHRIGGQRKVEVGIGAPQLQRLLVISPGCCFLRVKVANVNRLASCISNQCDVSRTQMMLVLDLTFAMTCFA